MRIIVKKALYYFILFNSLLLPEILPQQITVTSPNGGEDWQAGIDTVVTWSSDGISGPVSIVLLGADLVTNGDMELDSDWIDVGTPTLNKRSSTQAHGGTYSRKLKTAGAGWNGITQTNLSFSPNTTYRLSFWVYCVDNINLRYAVWDGNNDMFGTAFSGITQGAWRFVTKDFTSSSSADNTGNVQFITNATVATFYIDDVRIETVITSSTQNDGRKRWVIPYDLEGGTDYKVQITSVNDPNIFDLSDNNFTITANTITVTSPNGGENWFLDSLQTITWTANFSENVKIELYKGGIPNYTIINSTTNDGSRDWTPPSTLPEGSDYKIKITSRENNNIFDFSDADFTLSYNITVTSPNGGESLQAGTTHQITWYDNISDLVNIDLHKGGTFHSSIKASTTSDGSYNWNILYDIPGGSDYKVKITSQADPNLFDLSDADFTIPFKITVASPNGGESFQAGATKTITWADNISGFVKIELYKGGVFHSPITGSIPSNGTYNWIIPYDLGGATDYKIRITSLDDPDVFDFSDNNFTIVANQVTVTSPNGGENWLLGDPEPITWTDNFSERVKIELLKGGILIHTPTSSTQSDGLYNWNIPASLPEGSDYKIKITSLGSNNVFDFSDANFTLSFNITVTSPNGGESWQAGTTKQIHWTDNIAGKVKIDIYKGGVFHSSIKDTTNSDGTYNWSIPFDFQEGSDYKVRITSLDDPTLFDDSDNNFTIYLFSQITVIYPNGGEEWQTASGRPRPSAAR